MDTPALPSALTGAQKKEFSAFATAWLLEMEVLNNPQVKAALITNILKASDRIKSVELLTDTNQQKMLIYLDLNWVGRTFKKRTICSDVLDMLSQALPSYTFRITLDKALFAKAIKGFQASALKKKAIRTERK